MVKHIVFFKLKKSDDGSAEALREKLLSLKKEIGLIRNLEVGINFKESERAYDVALITDFDDAEDLAAYATHPYHLKVLEYIKTVISDSKVVDFKY